MQVTTGGSDATIATGGVVLNMVTKRGTNEWRGSRPLLRRRRLLAVRPRPRRAATSARPARGTTTRAQAAFNQGNRIVEVEDYGAELGGPIVKDRLWVWGPTASRRSTCSPIADVSDFTDARDLERQAQRPDRRRATRPPASPQQRQGEDRPQRRPDPAAGDHLEPGQVRRQPDRLQGRGHPDLQLELLPHRPVLGGQRRLQLVPQGGLDTGRRVLDADGVWHNTFLLYQTERPQEQFKADASYFFNTGSLQPRAQVRRRLPHGRGRPRCRAGRARPAIYDLGQLGGYA